MTAVPDYMWKHGEDDSNYVRGLASHLLLLFALQARVESDMMPD